MRGKKIVNLLLVAALLVTAVFAFAACGDEATGETVHKDKAIVIVTALFSGGLYDTTTGETVWDPLPEDSSFEQVMAGDMASIVINAITDSGTRDKVLTVLKFSTEEELKNNYLWNVSLNEDGVANNPNLKPTNTADGSYKGTSKVQYGALAAYKTQYEDLTAKYGDEYDVVMFNYDWRFGGEYNGRLLGEFIEKLGYKEVVITSHSLGGVVVSSFLSQYAKANGVEALNNLVKCYYPFAGAFQGSLDAIYYLDDTVQVIYDIIEEAALDIRNLGLLDDALNKLAVPFASNMTSIIQLLPTWEFLSSEYYDSTESCVMIGDYPIRGEQELYDFYCSRSWAKKADGTLKPAVAGIMDYWHSFYINVNGVQKHSTELVNTVYNVGCGLTTKKSFQFTKADGSTISTKGSFNHDKVIYGDGDGTVPLNSALAGLDIAEIYADGNRIHFYEKSDHGAVGCAWSLLREDFYAMMAELDAAG